MAFNRPRPSPKRGSPGWAAQGPSPQSRERTRRTPEPPPPSPWHGVPRQGSPWRDPGYGSTHQSPPPYDPPPYDQEYDAYAAYDQAPYDQAPYDQAAYDEPVAAPRPSRLAAARLAAWRGRQLTEQGFRRFHGAAGADGADRSGLRALTYATMANYATDAAIAVALANTLFFSAATAESKSKVALYLLITVAPFALVAPVIGPLLDRLQRGRRWALAGSFAARAALAVVMALHFNDWGLYPAALGVMVLSKSYTVLRAAVTPRVLPPTITLVTTNSRLTTFGMIAAGVFGGLAAGIGKLAGPQGALIYTAVACLAGVALCLRIPGWVEVTEGEVPATLRTGQFAAVSRSGPPKPVKPSKGQPMGLHVVVSLWGSGSIRLLTGFLTLFVAFVVKAETERDPSQQLLLLGCIGAAAGIGSFVGNSMGSRKDFARSDGLVLGCVAACVLASVGVAVFPGIPAATLCALIAAIVSALSKVALDAVIQRDLPERSRASAFGRSETVLQLAWVLGGAIGVLLPPVYWIGFTTVAVLVGLGGIQTALVSRGRSLLPWIRYPE